MPRRVPLSAEDCQRLGDLVGSLDVTQRVLADAAGVGQPWLSYLLRAERVTNVDAAKLEKLATALAHLARERSVAARLSADETQLALTFLSRFASSLATSTIPDIPAPGGPVAASAAIYVERDYDARLRALFDTGSNDVLVVGPPQSGKTTALAFVQRRAHELGIETAWFDPLPAISDVADIDAETATQVYELLRAKWRLSRTRGAAVDSIGTLLTWLFDETLPTKSKPRLLILDDLANIGHDNAARWVARFVRIFAKYRSVYDLRISIAVGMGHRYTTQFTQNTLIISAHGWKETIATRWFLLDDVDQMLRGFAAAQVSTPTVAELMSAAAGQPFLTHAAATDQNFYNALIAWAHNPTPEHALHLREQRPYRRHREAVAAALGVHRADDAVRSLLETFSKIVRAVRPDADVPNPLLKAMMPVDKEFLVRASLITMHGWPLMPLYVLISDDLLQSLQ